MRNLLKAGAILFGMALAFCLYANEVKATSTRAIGGYVGNNHVCGTTVNGTTLNGIWIEKLQ